MHGLQQNADVYDFGDVRVELASHRVLRNGKACVLEPKAFAVLQVLMLHADEVLSKERLLDAVWGHRHVTVGVLTRIISQLRHTLGDNSTSPIYIQTVHTLGYRFIGYQNSEPNAVTQNGKETKLSDNKSNGESHAQGRRFADAAHQQASGTDAVLARDHYVLGRRHWYERTTASLLLALEHFKKSVALDPTYAKSWCGIADTYLLLFEYSTLSLAVVERQSRYAIARALELKPNMGEAYAAQGLLEIQLQHYTVAIALLEQASAQCPRLSYVNAWLGMALTLDGNLLRAEEILVQALQFDEDDIVLLTAMAINQGMQANESNAEQFLLHALSINPAYLEIYWQQAWLRVQFGHLSKALDALAAANIHAGENAWTDRYMSQLYLIADCPQQAAEIIEKNIGDQTWPLLQPQIDLHFLRSNVEAAIARLRALNDTHAVQKESIAMLAQCYASVGKHEEALLAFDLAYPGDPQRSDLVLHPWEFDLGLGLRANQVALLSIKQPKRNRILGGLRRQLDHLHEGGMRVPNLYYQYAVIEALAGDEKRSLAWLDQALDGGFCDLLAVRKSLVWKSFGEREALEIRMLRLEAHVFDEKKKILRLH